MVTGSFIPPTVDHVYYSQKNRKLAMKIMREMIKYHTINPNELRSQLSNTNNPCSHKRIRIAIQRLVSLGLVEKYVVFKTDLKCSCDSQRFVIKASTYEENHYYFLHLLKCRNCRQRHNFSMNNIHKQNQNDYALSEHGLLYALFLVDPSEQIKAIHTNTEFEFFNLLNILIHSQQKIHAEMMLEQLKQDIKHTFYLKPKSIDFKNKFDEIIQILTVDSNDSKLFEYKQKILSQNQTFLPLNFFSM